MQLSNIRKSYSMSSAAPGGTRRLQTAVGRSSSARTRQTLVVNNFISVDKGIKKVKHMLDFGKQNRLDVLHQLYGAPSLDTFHKVLSDNFKMVERGSKRSYSKADYTNMMCNVILPAVPDFTWGHLTNGDVDDDGYCIVTVKAGGHHTGEPLKLPGLPPIPPSGKRFTLAQETHKVKVVGSQVDTIIALPTMDPGPKALYDALKDPHPATLA